MRTTRLNGGTTLVLAGFLAVAFFFLLSEHRAHFFGALPWLLLMACPLLHLLHRHGGHGDHPEQGRGRPDLSEGGDHESRT